MFQLQVTMETKIAPYDGRNEGMNPIIYQRNFTSTSLNFSIVFDAIGGVWSSIYILIICEFKVILFSNSEVMRL